MGWGFTYRHGDVDTRPEAVKGQARPPYVLPHPKKRIEVDDDPMRATKTWVRAACAVGVGCCLLLAFGVTLLGVYFSRDDHHSEPCMTECMYSICEGETRCRVCESTGCCRDEYFREVFYEGRCTKKGDEFLYIGILAAAVGFASCFFILWYVCREVQALPSDPVDNPDPVKQFVKDLNAPVHHTAPPTLVIHQPSPAVSGLAFSPALDDDDEATPPATPRAVVPTPSFVGATTMRVSRPLAYSRSPSPLSAAATAAPDAMSPHAETLPPTSPQPTGRAAGAASTPVPGRRRTARRVRAAAPVVNSGAAFRAGSEPYGRVEDEGVHAARPHHRVVQMPDATTPQAGEGQRVSSQCTPRTPADAQYARHLSAGRAVTTPAVGDVEAPPPLPPRIQTPRGASMPPAAGVSVQSLLVGWAGRPPAADGAARAASTSRVQTPSQKPPTPSVAVATPQGVVAAATEQGVSQTELLAYLRGAVGVDAAQAGGRATPSTPTQGGTQPASPKTPVEAVAAATAIPSAVPPAAAGTPRGRFATATQRLLSKARGTRHPSLRPASPPPTLPRGTDTTTPPQQAQGPESVNVAFDGPTFVVNSPIELINVA